MFENIFRLGGNMRLDLEVLGIEPPELITATSLVFRRLVLLDVTDKVTRVFELILLEKARVTQEFPKVSPVTIYVFGQKTVGEQFSRVEGRILAGFDLELFLDS